MQYYIILLSIIMLIITSCSWRLRNNTLLIPTNIKILITELNDLNIPLRRAIQHQLHVNHIQLIQHNSLFSQDVYSLHILDSNLIQHTTSVFKNGNTAEYQITLSIKAEVLIPEKDIYPIDIKTYRMFFNNPQTALAKDIERQIIIKEMYDKAAEILIHKLLSIIYTQQKINSEISIATVAYYYNSY